MNLANNKSSLLCETIYKGNGVDVTRIRSSVFYYSSLISLVLGFYLISGEHYIGAFLIITLCPFLLLYPLVRYLFGGKDSVGVVVATAITEELLKSELKKAVEKKPKRKR